MTSEISVLTKPSCERFGDAHLTEAHRVLSIEAAAIETLKSSLDSTFSEAVERLFVLQGRLIVTGMGKSGWVARKIAATLASTGTPAFFVHPAEASHGDLGMITDQDAVLALSYSGETTELLNIVQYAKRYGLPLMSISGSATNTLAQAADYPLTLPKVEEACPLGLAPTTSTTLMMVLGDALATSLLKKRGFSSQDFEVFHPGGQLGRKLLQVRDIMRADTLLPIVSETHHMDEAILVMTEKGLGCTGVVDSNGILVGIVTDGDLRRHMGDSLLKTLVKEVMTPHPKVIGAQMLVAEAVRLMNADKVTSLFVIEDAQEMHTPRPLGIIHMHDCLKLG